MEEARWADTATEGLGGGPGRKGYRVRPPAKGCSGGSWALCRERGSRMISSLAARRGSLTPRAESWNHSTAECQSWKKPDAPRCSASSAPAPASPSPCLCWAVCSAHPQVAFTTTLRGQ